MYRHVKRPGYGYGHHHHHHHQNNHGVGLGGLTLFGLGLLFGAHVGKQSNGYDNDDNLRDYDDRYDRKRED